MADSRALLIAHSALQIIKEIGFPEANIPLSHAIIYVCEAPKSNSVIVAMNLAKQDASKINDDVPSHLKNNDNLDSENPNGYKYPHNFGGFVKQQYLPNSIKDKIYYTPSKNGEEANIKRKKLD